MSGYPPPQGDYPPQYPPPQQGYPPPQQGGYPPPQQGYPPPQQGYPPPQQGYAQPAQQQQSNVVVVQAQQPQVVTQTIVKRDDRPNHLLHAIITFLFWPWIFVWLLVCLIYGC